ncbi:unnamed protein product [Calypogeia fissa]
MDTPSRRVTRSQMSTLNPSSAGKPQARGGVGSSKKKELPRPPFTDLTNDSPISGLIPAKLVSIAGIACESTPRSRLRPADRPIGEDLLRMQVTSLLRKVESEALVLQNNHNVKALPATKDLLESPMRLAAPTPANTPATAGVAVAVPEVKAVAMLPPIAIASPVCNVDATKKLERISPAFVSTAELLSAIEEVIMELSFSEFFKTSTVVQEQPTTRTLKFDSPQRQVPGIEGESSSTEVPTPASVSTVEILNSIEESEAQLGNRTLRFDSPQKAIPDAEILSELFSPSAHPHPRIRATEDEDSWSVIVNVNSPEKLEGADDTTHFVDVPTTSEVDTETVEFIQNVLVDPEIDQQPLAEIPSLWERRDTPPNKSGLKNDDDDYEDCEEYDDEDYAEEEEDEEDDEEEDNFEHGTETFDEACEELCKGISTINMGGEGSKGLLPTFEGKHTRFVYHSDDEEEFEEEIVSDKKTLVVDSPGKTKLMGLPTPKGKHIRFHNEEAESDSD